MGNPAIYYYPDPAGSLEVIDLAEPLSDLQITQLREVADTYTRGGSFFRTSGASRLQVRIILENFTSAPLVRQFETLSAHLERGGSIGFALDASKAWAGFVDVDSRSPIRGSTTISTVASNQFSAWNSGASLATNDEVSVSSPPPEGLRETRYVSAGISTGKTMSLTGNPLVYSYQSGVVLVRHRDFFPSLVMPEGSVGDPIVESNHRISYTLDLTLVEDWGTLQAIGETSAALRATTGLPVSGVSLQEALENYRAQVNDAWVSEG